MPSVEPATLILASSSATRARMLRAAGLVIETMDPGVDESAIKTMMADETAAVIAAALARAKALAVTAAHPKRLVVAADQILVCDGHTYDKAADMAAARSNLRALSGRVHELWSAVCLSEGETLLWSHVACARLHMREVSDVFLDEYLARVGEDALRSVGAYRLEGLGANLFERIEGDVFTILGLPLLALLGALRERGVLPA